MSAPLKVPSPVETLDMRPVDPSLRRRAVELMRVPLPMPITVVLGTHDR